MEMNDRRAKPCDDASKTRGRGRVGNAVGLLDACVGVDGEPEHRDCLVMVLGRLCSGSRDGAGVTQARQLPREAVDVDFGAAARIGEIRVRDVQHTNAVRCHRRLRERSGER